MEDIARRAGVAVGTLYRHFPAKEDLLGAVIDDSVEQLAVLSEAALAAVDAGADPGPVFAGLLRAVAGRYVDDRALKSAAGRLQLGGDLGAHLDGELSAAAPGSAVLRAVTAITQLLERSVAAGAVRADVTLDDLIVVLGGVPGREVSEAMQARYVDIVIAGLTAPA